LDLLTKEYGIEFTKDEVSQMMTYTTMLDQFGAAVHAGDEAESLRIAIEFKKSYREF